MRAAHRRRGGASIIPWLAGPAASCRRAPLEVWRRPHAEVRERVLAALPDPGDGGDASPDQAIAPGTAVALRIDAAHAWAIRL